MNRLLCRRKPAAVLIAPLCLLLAAVLLAAVIVESAKSKADHAILYGSTAEKAQRVYICPQYMSKEFASFEALESDRFYLMLSANMDVYVVCISDASLPSYKPLQDFTYLGDVPQPDIPVIYGTCVPIEDELVPYAVDAVNSLFGQDLVTADTLTDITGLYYIDTTASAPASDFVPVCVAIAAALSILGVVLIWRRISFSRISRATANRMGTEFAEVSRQLEEPETQYFKSLGLYLTQDYLIGYKMGVRIVPITSLCGVRGLLTGRSARLCIEDRDHGECLLCTAPRNLHSITEYREAVRALSLRRSGLEYGTSRRIRTDEVDPAQLDDFYSMDERRDLRIQEAINDGSMSALPNYALGILGALIGAALGGTVWVAVGKLGYLSGLIGGLMIWLALRGFRLLGKTLDKAGAVISCILAALMIPAANYVVYAWAFRDAMGSRYTFIRALEETWGMMRENGLLGSYFKDLSIGLLFFVLVGWPMMKNVFTPAVKAARILAAGVPVYPMQPTAGMPSTDPLSEDAGPHVILPGKIVVLGVVAGFLGTALFLFLTVMIILENEGNIAGFIVMSLAFAAAFLSGALYLIAVRRRRIEYDTRSVRLITNKRIVELPWEDVTELRLRNPNMMSIRGNGMKISFDLSWSGWEQLVYRAYDSARSAAKK